MPLKYKIRSLKKHAKDLPLSLIKRSEYKSKLQDLETFCLFIGYPRSGHSIMGALIDAHPNAIIAHEQDALDYIDKGYSPDQIYYLLIKNSIYFARRGRKWTGYSYQVNNQWQGAFSNPKVIGDNLGGGTTQRLSRNPKLLQKVENKIPLNTKFIHVVRNPYDNIVSMARGGKPVKREVTEELIKNEMAKFFREANMNNYLKQVWQDKILDVHHEDFVNDPQEQLRQICNFLNIEPLEDYLNSCAQIVKSSANRSRTLFNWSDELIDYVAKEIETIPFLKHYCFEK